MLLNLGTVTNPDAKAKARELEATDVPLRIPTIAIQELYVAVGLGSNSFENAQKFAALVGNKPIVDLDERIARRAGVLQGVHAGSDVKPDLGLGDAVIAATALQFNEPVVTNDTSDFGSVEGLAVVTP